MNPIINYGNTQQNPSGGIPEGMVGYQQALFSQGQMGYTIPHTNSQIPMIDSSSIVNSSVVVPQHQQNEKMDMALEFLEQVKSAYESRPHVYMQFLDIMKDFKNQSIDTNGVIERVKTLFEGHPELVEGFNNFLPPPLKIKKYDEYEPEDEEEREDHPPIRTRQRHREAREQLKVEHKTEDFDQARNYVRKIKQRFISQPQVYKSFLEILHTFSREQISTEDIYHRVSQLFKDHPDLLEEFSNFLPESAIVNQEQQYQPKARPTRSKTASAESKTASPSKRSKKYTEEPIGSNGTFEELMNIFKIKQVLPQLDFKNLLKVLDLYNNNIVTKKELYFFLRNLFKGNHKDLLNWFQEFIKLDDIEEEHEIEEEQDISKETGPNEIEELNYLIETNQTTIDFLNDLKTKFPENPNEFILKESDVDEVSQEAIRRLYGDRGDEIFDLFIKHPAKVVDILLNRLKQKNEEFLVCREEWRKLYQEEKEMKVESEKGTAENKEPEINEQVIKKEEEKEEKMEVEEQKMDVEEQKMEVEEQKEEKDTTTTPQEPKEPQLTPSETSTVPPENQSIKVESYHEQKEQHIEVVHYQQQPEVVTQEAPVHETKVKIKIESPSDQSEEESIKIQHGEEKKSDDSVQIQVEVPIKNDPNVNVKNEETVPDEVKQQSEEANVVIEKKTEPSSILNENNNMTQNGGYQVNNESQINQ